MKNDKFKMAMFDAASGSLVSVMDSERSRDKVRSMLRTMLCSTVCSILRRVALLLTECSGFEEDEKGVLLILYNPFSSSPTTRYCLLYSVSSYRSYYTMLIF